MGELAGLPLQSSDELMSLSTVMITSVQIVTNQTIPPTTIHLRGRYCVNLMNTKNDKLNEYEIHLNQSIVV